MPAPVPPCWLVAVQWDCARYLPTACLTGATERPGVHVLWQVVFEQAINSHEYDALKLCVYNAAQSNHTRALRLLCDVAQRRNASNLLSASARPRGLTPLAVAAHHGHVEAVQVLARVLSALQLNIGGGGPVLGVTPLYLAAQAGHTTAVRALIAAGAAVDTPNELGTSPAMAAAEAGHLSALTALAEQGHADLLARNLFGSLCLHAAARHGHAACVAYLVRDRGLDPDCRNTAGHTPLLLAVRHGRVAAAAALLTAGADTRYVNPRGGATLLMQASRGGFVDMVELLLSHCGHAAVVAEDFHGTQALAYAARKNHTPVMECLLTAGAAVDARNHNGCTALMLASQAGSADAVQCLLQHGADPTMRDNRRGHRSAADTAALCQHYAVVQALRHAEAMWLLNAHAATGTGCCLALVVHTETLATSSSAGTHSVGGSDSSDSADDTSGVSAASSHEQQSGGSGRQSSVHDTPRSRASTPSTVADAVPLAVGGACAGGARPVDLQTAPGTVPTGAAGASTAVAGAGGPSEPGGVEPATAAMDFDHADGDAASDSEDGAYAQPMSLGRFLRKWAPRGH